MQIWVLAKKVVAIAADAYKWPQLSSPQVNTRWWRLISIWRGKSATLSSRRTSHVSWQSFYPKCLSGWTESQCQLGLCSVSVLAFVNGHSLPLVLCLSYKDLHQIDNKPKQTQVYECWISHTLWGIHSSYVNITFVNMEGWTRTVCWWQKQENTGVNRRENIFLRSFRVFF